jgi:hypothetical protein
MKRLILALLLLGSPSMATSAHWVCLDWNPGTYPKTVTLRVWRQKNQAAYVQVQQVSNTVTSWTDTNVVAGAQYSYYVIACDLRSKDCSAASNVVTVSVP